jgi:DNA sulfur modification protein DndD
VIFRRISLVNFGIFHGTQTLELGPGLYVVHGENGRGKTTILNAVKWAFFGRYLNRQGKVVNPSVIINRDAFREGERKFSVTLVLDDSGVELLVRRTWQAGEQAEGELYVERAGTALNQLEANHTLRNLLDEQVSRFFLFDGEQLREYEELLFEEEESARLVKGSIEQILGLPVLQNAVDDLGSVADEIGKRIARAARQSDRTRQQGLQAQQLESEIGDAEADLADLEQQKADAEVAVADADAVLQRYDSSQDILKQIEALETELEGIDEQRAVAREDLGRALADTWRDALFVAVAPQRAAMQAELAERRDADLKARDDARLRTSLERGACVLCEQPLAPETVQSLEAKLGPPAAGGEPPDDLDVAQRVMALSVIMETGRLEDAVTLDERIASIDSKKASKGQELKQVRDTVQDVPEEDIRAAAEKRDKGQRDLGQIEHLIGRKRDDIAGKRGTLQDLLRQIASSGGSAQLSTLQERQQLARDLADLFSSAKDRYREDLRGRVEEASSEIFKRLTTEPAYTGLQINESYGLESLGPDGEVAPGRSAGQEQIVALALIGALNQSATRRAPVMMDTPFGRLDSNHRAKVLAYLADMADQVFLLVHSAEVSRADLDNIAADIAAEFDLRRSSAFQTEIREATV